VELNHFFVNMIAVVAILVGLGLAGWWIIGLYGIHSRREEHELPEVDLPGHMHEVVSGVPPVLWLFYALMFATLVLYVLYIWLGGVSY